jgi:hypothetical protein
VVHLQIETSKYEGSEKFFMIYAVKFSCNFSSFGSEGCSSRSMGF